ncbi:hypothetical protein A5821_001596 [Enterococcus sp. 7F3_DIV0205]|uniref:Uncharacterized protein n=1 Tax=Candidatus Enterococcus palustris TaxID=1834189 RepID=A0AAQ3W8F5_9ENTE|nr:hypothetical protein [Enterococcus sp. 7F3_DIV0205]OTN85991.1 hypothetical protein A5821_001941 [Enterococcus sp. 7F3_DIV0205]
MADIVQLEEKGNLLYPKTHTSAIDNFEETVVKKTGDEEIAGIKNFKDGLQSNGKTVATKSDYFGLSHTGKWTLTTNNNKLPLGGTQTVSASNFCTLNSYDVTVNKSTTVLVGYMASVHFETAGGWADIRLYKNDTLVSNVALSSPQGVVLSGSGSSIVKLNTGDKLSVRIIMDSNLINKANGRNPNLTIVELG